MCYSYCMTTNHLTAEAIPEGFWLASDLDDHLLAWGHRDDRIGDAIPVTDLERLVLDYMVEEAEAR